MFVAVKLIYLSTALVLLLFVLSAALLAMLVMSDEENRALRSELDDTRQMLQNTQGELYENVELVREKDSLIGRQKANISALSADLDDRDSEIASLQQELAQTGAELEEAETTLQEAEEEISALKEETLDMAASISQSIAWFTDNAELPSTLKVDRFVSKAEKGCIDGDELNLGCVSYLMAEELDMEYKVDPTGDRLYSLEEIVEREGGDCEDYSLFFKAVLNRLGDGLELEAWEEGTGRYELYQDIDTHTIWYYDDANGKTIEGEDLNPYVACYYYDRSDHFWVGHCIIMLTEEEISSPGDISPETLADAQFFEPQTGEYSGRMGGEFNTCVEGQNGCEDIFDNIVFIITDQDLFEFSDGRWNYYGGYLERAEAILDELEGIAT